MSWRRKLQRWQDEYRRLYPDLRHATDKEVRRAIRSVPRHFADPVQTKAQTTPAVGNGNSTSISFSSLPGVGNKVQVAIYGFDASGGITFTGGTPITCTDNQSGNTYTLRSHQIGGDAKTWVAIWELISVVGSSGTFTITVNDSIGNNLNFLYGAAIETSAHATRDNGAAESLTNTGPHPGSVTPATSSDFVVMVMSDGSGSNPAISASPSGATSIQKTTNGTVDQVGEVLWLLKTDALAYDPTWTIASSALWSAASEFTMAGGDTLMGQACL